MNNKKLKILSFFLLYSGYISSIHENPYGYGANGNYFLNDAELAKKRQEKEDEKLAQKLQEKEDAKLAQKLQKEELSKKLKIKNAIDALKKLIEKYEKNYKSFIEHNEQAKKILYTLQDPKLLVNDCIALSTCQRIPNAFQRRLKNEIDILTDSIYRKNSIFNVSRNFIEKAVAIYILKNELEISMSNKIKNLNPGAQGTYDVIFEHGLMQDGDEKKELKLVMYFYFKEHYGELCALLNQIK